MKVWKRFSFEAAHSLPEFPCVHGHSYTAEVWFEGAADDGYVVRESDLARLTDEVRGSLDHRFLNDIMDVPTSENIARFIWNAMRERGVRRVCVFRESCGLGVEYEGR